MRVVLGRAFGLAVVAALALGACGDDSDGDTPMEDAGVDSGPATGGTGGDTPTGGTGGTTTTPTDAAAPGPVTFECGQTMCTVPDLTMGIDLSAAGGLLPMTGDAGAGLGGLSLEGCCLDGDVCGLQSDGLLGGLGCVEQAQAGTPDEGCPDIVASLDIMGFALTNNLPGCCQTASGLCGVDLSNVGLDLGPLGAIIGGLFPIPESLDLGVGCIELSEAAMIMNPNQMILTDAGTDEPIACGPGAGDGGADEDAGN